MTADNDKVIAGIEALGFCPQRVAEVGCGGGARLAEISHRFNAECSGFDPSSVAVSHATKAHPNVRFAVGTADKVDLPDSSVDLLIFGFCLYLADPLDHFRIAAEADRVLADGGFIVVLDFVTPAPFRNPYTHRPGVFSTRWSFVGC